MKNVGLMLLLIIVSFAYSNAEEETLFGNGEITHGGYGGPELKVTQINGEWGLAVGGRGGWIINSSLSLGGGGYGIVTKHLVDYDYSQDPNAEIRMNVGWGGAFIEYINSSNKVIHATANILIGAGGANYVIFDDGKWDDYKSLNESSSFFVIEPGITADINLFKFFRISLGASYRFVSGLELFNTDGKIINRK
jgi:hypothetical protein